MVTVLSYLPVLQQMIVTRMDVDALTLQLKNMKSQPSGDDKLAQTQLKMQLWERIKVGSVASTLASLYAVMLLTVLLKIQMNMLGRYSYADSIRAIESGGDAND